ncbi:MAG: glycosyltransferase, partial [Verrucomicrobiota bacterium JB023]|nr:glycosyltransferase [Verrucomicrobiota bacterium JB023]
SVEVVCVDNPEAGYLGDDPFRITALGPSQKFWSYSKKLEPWLRENLRNFDVVILHGLWLYPSFALLKALQKLTRKVGKDSVPRFYLYPHGMLDPWFQKDPSRRLKAIRNEVYWRLIESKVVNHADGILFTCEEERRLAALAFPNYRPRGEYVVGYGIPEPPEEAEAMLSAFRSSVPELPEGRPYLLFLSRIHQKKGVDILLRAYARLYAESGSSMNRRGKFPALVLAGSLEGEFAQEMQSMVQSLFGDQRGPEKAEVHFSGLLQGDAKWGAFYGCEAFVLPSHQENFGIAVVEALACHKPVLITNKVNIWQEIEDAKAGFISNDDEDGVYQALKSFLESNNGLDPNGPRDCYREHFTVEAASTRLGDLLKSEVGRASGEDSRG